MLILPTKSITKISDIAKYYNYCSTASLYNLRKHLQAAGLVLTEVLGRRRQVVIETPEEHLIRTNTKIIG